MRPEYQRGIGGSQETPKYATRNCPATLSANSASSAQSAALSPRGSLFRSPFRKVHPLVMPVPLALEELLGVVLQLQLEELLHLREAGVDLAAQGVAVV